MTICSPIAQASPKPSYVDVPRPSSSTRISELKEGRNVKRRRKESEKKEGKKKGAKGIRRKEGRKEVKEEGNNEGKRDGRKAEEI